MWNRKYMYLETNLSDLGDLLSPAQCTSTKLPPLLRIRVRVRAGVRAKSEWVGREWLEAKGFRAVFREGVLIGVPTSRYDARLNM